MTSVNKRDYDLCTDTGNYFYPGSGNFLYTLGCKTGLNPDHTISMNSIYSVIKNTYENTNLILGSSLNKLKKYENNINKFYKFSTYFIFLTIIIISIIFGNLIYYKQFNLILSIIIFSVLLLFFIIISSLIPEYNSIIDDIYNEIYNNVTGFGNMTTLLTNYSNGLKESYTNINQ